MSQETAAKKDTQRLQRAIVEGLEDVKAQDIQVFNTEHLSPLFERVIVASGTSNRQTKALAASVRDAVREAGFTKPRIEGEENGEWIIVDCGAAVAHIMQPAIRQYYHLEEIWGDKPVRLKFGAAKPAVAKEPMPAVKPAAAKPSAGRPVAGKSPAGKNSAGKSPAGKFPAGKSPAGKFPAGKASSGKPAAGKPSASRTGTARPAAAKSPAKSPANLPTKKAPIVKVGAPKAAAKKAPARKSNAPRKSASR